MLNKYEPEGFEPIQDKPIQFNSVKPIEFVSYTSQYELPKITTETIKNEFRQNKCEKGHLVNKGQKIRIDMAEHVYPEVSFNNNKCNICDPTCDFNIMENQINTNERMLPKSGR
jgi:hypothetical protein